MKTSARIKFEDVAQTSLQLTSSTWEGQIRSDLETGSRIPRQITYEDINGIPISSSITSIAATVSGDTTSENVTFKHGEDGVLFSADSMTKTITAACILRMNEESKYSRYLPHQLETTLGDLSEILLQRFPESAYLQAQLQDPEFCSISLRELMMHTSGLAKTSSGSLEAQLQSLRDGRTKLTVTEILDAEKSAEKPTRGQHSYSNLSYELLGAVLIAIHSEANQKPIGENSHYDELVNELVITPVKEKMVQAGAQEAARNLRFITSDQMTAETPARFGETFYQGEFREIPSHTYDTACGGSYATSESMAHIALHVLSDKPQLSIFTPETLELMNQPESSVEADASTNYGLGFRFLKGATFVRLHDGLGYGSNSRMSVNNQENKAAVVMVAFEQNLTLPLANALINQTRVVKGLKPDQKSYEKSLELRRNYSDEQLLEMRCDLQESYEKFSEKFNQFEQARSSRPLNSPRQVSSEVLAESSIANSFEV